MTAMSFLLNSVQPVKRFVTKRLNKHGYYSVKGLGYELCNIEDFLRQVRDIKERGLRQTEEQVAALRKKYEQPILGEVRVQRLLELLAQIIDQNNRWLYCTSQLTHTLQVLESMEKAGITDPDMLVTAVIHDLGKLSLLKGESPENVEAGGRRPLRAHEPGIGLENGSFTWDHADIVHARFQPYVPENIAWLLRWHSIRPACVPIMNAKDREYFEKYYKTFVVHDRTFAFYHVPSARIDKYFPLVDKYFPNPILF